jgi:tetratricopeptide repeat protein 30
VGILARHLYDMQKYDELETLHSRMGHVFNTSPDWTINIANASFAQKKYETACKYYESVVLGTKESLLLLSPAILANLCVCWLETDQNDRAEQLMTDVHELELNHDNHIHSTIINLVIGYLYCSKGNFEFGMDRVMESLKKERNIQSETWFYCKSVFMTLSSAAASGTGPHLADNFIDRMVSFLETISAIKAPIASDQPDQTIQKEAEIILRLINKLYCD